MFLALENDSLCDCLDRKAIVITDTETHFIGVKKVSVRVSVLWAV